MIPARPEDEVDEYGNPILLNGMAPPPLVDPDVVQPIPAPDPILGEGEIGGAPASAPEPSTVQAPLSVMPPEQSKTVTRQGSSGIIQSPEAKQAADEYEKAADDLIDATARREEADTKIQVADAQANFRKAERDRAIRQMEEQDLAAAREKRDNAVAQAEAEIQKRDEDVQRKYEATKQGYWDDQPWWKGVVGALMVGSSVADAYTLGTDPNNTPTVRAMETGIAQHRQQRLDDYVRSKEFAAEARKGKQAALDAYELAKEDINLDIASNLAIGAAELESMKATTRLDPAKIEATAEAAIAKEQQLRSEVREKRAQRLERKSEFSVTRTDVDKPPPAKVTDAMRNAAATGEDSQNVVNELINLPEISDKDLQELKKGQRWTTSADATAERGGLLGLAGTGAVNALSDAGIIPWSPVEKVTQAGQVAAQAWAETFAKAVKNISGAAVSAQEFVRLAPVYMPQIGEGIPARRSRLLRMVSEIEATAHKAAPDQAQAIRTKAAQMRQQIEERYRDAVKVGGKVGRRRSK